MSLIRLDGVRHSYYANPQQPADWALQELNVSWADGGAYALLGPSGCGKTTLLNLISGLLAPTAGRIWFDDQDVTELPTTQRNIAQVFQFPVVYDTMTVFDNLAFPLRNRNVPEADVTARVREIAELVGLTDSLTQRAAGLTAEDKQKISLGRGLVRFDVNVIMFDEPLTVIDPHLKWQLRSKLKELHQRFGATMIYVTHDQTEALTFADQVVVMLDGQVVQTGTPVELFEQPQHTFVGHFIGSPGMNLLPCELQNGQVIWSDQPIEVANLGTPGRADASLELGVRPEFVQFAPDGIDVQILRVGDAGRYRVVTVQREQDELKVLVPEGQAIPSDGARIKFNPQFTRVYADGWVLGGGVPS